ncbi:uncharacterized protein LOC128159638 isoform X1 [Crassostrea angulata]|uniref:uncharacterized protein LOC128159638 isoform X1 n=2 Tax=Magallana angulata TaxID=2784310 RepID=UPI0022B1DC9C|nr:uncharacterized protein LOC128159638 isoform X1 [Crassostrea angulata]
MIMQIKRCIPCHPVGTYQLATYMGKRRQRSREAVKVKSKRRKIRKRETLLLNRSIPSTEESPSTSNIDQETLAAVSEDVADYEDDLKNDQLYKDFRKYLKAKADVEKYSSRHVINTVDGIVKRHIFLTEPYKY